MSLTLVPSQPLAMGGDPLPAPTLPSLEIAARYGGKLSLAADGYRFFGAGDLPVIVVLGGISAGRQVAQSEQGSGWWEALVGPGCAIDTRCRRVLGMDWAWRDRGPVDSFDQADLLAAILEREAIPSVSAIVGSSYGGMVGLAFAARYPERVSRLVVLSAAHKSHPMATAIRVIQRRIILLGRQAGKPAAGVALARALGLTTYRTREEFSERFEIAARVADDEVRFPVEEYLDAQGERFADHFPDARYLSLSESLDLHQVEPGQIGTPTTLVAVDRDTLVPTCQMRELFASLQGPGRFVEISSRYGHDAFLKEIETIGDILTRALGGRYAR